MFEIFDVAEHLPLVIEIVDTEETIKAFLPTLDAMTPGASYARASAARSVE
jgi:PII-like signaling protein